MRPRGWLESLWWQPRLGPDGWLLLPLSGLYRAMYRARDWSFQVGLKRARSAPVPVVVVGNLIVGGAGKTPTTLALVAGLRARGWTPGIISRGYGGQRTGTHAVEPDTDATQCGDEPLLLRRRSAAPVWTGRNRPDAADALCRAHPDVDILVSDDGLQHRALSRDAQVIVFDERGAGNGCCLPAGPLREPWVATPPERSVVVYNTAEPSTAWPGHCARRKLGQLQTLGDWWAGNGRTLETEDLPKTALIAAAGIAEPERFFGMLEQRGLKFLRCPLPDHAALDPRPWPQTGGRVLVTEKDAVKLPPGSPDADRIVVATLDFELPSAFWAALLPLLPTTQPRRSS